MKWRRIAGRTALYGCGVLLLAVGIRELLAADGYFSGSPHANTTTGVNRDVTKPRGNCSQCHETHGAAGYDFSVWTTNDKTLCQTAGCHNAAGDRSYQGAADYDLSGHGNSIEDFPAAGGRDTQLCVQCHDPHGKGDGTNGLYPNHLEFWAEESTCMSNSGTAGNGCHGSSGNPASGKNLYTAFTTYTSIHNYALADGRHVNTEAQTYNSGAFSGVNRHVECIDCHNPHYAQAGTHASPSTNPPYVSNVLLGAWGVYPTTWPTPPSLPAGGPAATITNYTAVTFTSTADPTMLESYLCLKCHSSFAYADTPPTAPSGGQESDVTKDFNTGNLGFHPVFGVGKNQPGALNPNFASTFVNGWAANSRVYCTDCHGSHNLPSGTDSEGAHGSNNPYMLRGGPSAGPSQGSGAEANVMCYNCHNPDVYDDAANNKSYSRWDHDTRGDHATNTDNTWGIWCLNCHAGDAPGAIHGSNRGTTSYGGGTGTSGYSGLGERLVNGASIASMVKATTTNNSGDCTVDGGAYTYSTCGSSHSRSWTANYNY